MQQVRAVYVWDWEYSAFLSGVVEAFLWFRRGCFQRCYEVGGLEGVVLSLLCLLLCSYYVVTFEDYLIGCYVKREEGEVRLVGLGIYPDSNFLNLHLVRLGLSYVR
jgi:hypothetical protein